MYIPTDEVFAKIQLQIFGASESIDVLVFTNSNILDMLTAVDSRLHLRCILSLPDYSRKFPKLDNLNLSEREKVSIKYLQQCGWDVRLSTNMMAYSYIIIDNESLFFSELQGEPNLIPTLSFHQKGDRNLRSMRDDFDFAWFNSKPIDVVYEDSSHLSDDNVKNGIVVASEDTWNQIIAALSYRPEQLYSLSPRKFEELIAELLMRDGMEIQLTPPTKDGGRDILAISETQAGQHLYLVECKRYANHKPIGVGLVRALYGVVEAEKATAGLLVTTSSFTRGALSFQESVKYKLGLKDYSNLINWLKRSLH